MKETKLFELVIGTEMKLWLSRNMLLNINTCKNGWSNFSANLRVVSLKLLELTQFAWPNISIYFNFLCAVPHDDVNESTCFLMRPPVNHSTMALTMNEWRRALCASVWHLIVCFFLSLISFVCDLKLQIVLNLITNSLRFEIYFQ